MNPSPQQRHSRGRSAVIAVVLAVIREKPRDFAMETEEAWKRSLEGPGGIGRFVLYEQIRQPGRLADFPGPHKGRVPLTEGNLISRIPNWKEGVEPPRFRAPPGSSSPRSDWRRSPGSHRSRSGRPRRDRCRPSHDRVRQCRKPGRPRLDPGRQRHVRGRPHRDPGRQRKRDNRRTWVPVDTGHRNGYR